jgi:hypothetical protein
MSTTEWHLDAELASGYAEGRTGAVLSASVEQHLITCARCRTLMDAEVSADRIDAVLAEVIDRVETPRRSLLERALGQLGVGEGTARLVATTPSLRGAWVTGVIVVLALALATAYSGPHGVALFMALAPVLPVAGVAFAFGPASDPAHQIAAASPYPQLRLLAIRAAFVVATTVLPAAVAGALLPGEPWLAVAWLLPALALTVSTVALSTRLAPHVAAFGLSAVWLGVVLPGLLQRGDPTLAAELPVQLISCAVLVASAVALIVQRHELPELIRRAS